MEKHIQIITDLSLKLDELSDSSGYILEKLELAIGCCKTALEQMREFVLQEGFPDQKSEIHFFKKLKPSVNSKLIYYLQVFDIQSKLPIADDQKVIQYLKKRIDRIHEFTCLLYTSDAADEEDSVDLGG